MGDTLGITIDDLREAEALDEAFYDDPLCCCEDTGAGHDGECCPDCRGEDI